MMILSPWRADFPAIAALQRQGQTYLDSAATTQKPQALLDALAHYYANGAANVHRAQHLPGALATQAFEDSRLKVSQWLNAGNCGQVVFTHGATSALNLPADAVTALETFQAAAGWEQRARLLMQWGDRLPALSDVDKVDANRVHGCESQVWLVGALQDGHWQLSLIHI